jgi:hypothetical protein
LVELARITFPPRNLVAAKGLALCLPDCSLEINRFRIEGFNIQIRISNIQRSLKYQVPNQTGLGLGAFCLELEVSLDVGAWRLKPISSSPSVALEPVRRQNTDRYPNGHRL